MSERLGYAVALFLGDYNIAGVVGRQRGYFGQERHRGGRFDIGVGFDLGVEQTAQDIEQDGQYKTDEQTHQRHL